MALVTIYRLLLGEPPRPRRQRSPSACLVSAKGFGLVCNDAPKSGLLDVGAGTSGIPSGLKFHWKPNYHPFFLVLFMKPCMYIYICIHMDDMEPTTVMVLVVDGSQCWKVVVPTS